MLVILPSTQWPDSNSVHSIRSRASRLVKNDNNPFLILYDSSADLRQSANTTGISGNTTANTTGHSHPTVTIVDGLSRNGSTISRLASVNNRNSIRRRNKMVKKSDLPPDLLVDDSLDGDSLKKKRSKVRWIFPIRRKSSFKYKPVNTPRFRSQKDVDEYYRKNELDLVMRELLPPLMAAYKFSNILNLVPVINIHPYSAAAPQELPLPEILAPKQATIKPLNDDIYDNYKQAVFAGKFRSASRLEDVMPHQALYMAPADREAVETRLLFAILIRRTVAAKLNYRLSHSGYKPKRPLSKPSKNTLTSSSDDNDSTAKKHPDNESPSKKPSHSTLSSNDPIKPRPSGSDHLPSPQLSLSGAFMDLDNYPLSTASFKLSRKSYYDNQQMTPSPSNRFIYDFSNVDMVDWRQRQQPQRLSNLQLYTLQPQRRSASTLSSSAKLVSDISKLTPPTPEAHKMSIPSTEEEFRLSWDSSIIAHQHRPSDETKHTSIFKASHAESPVSDRSSIHSTHTPSVGSPTKSLQLSPPRVVGLKTGPLQTIGEKIHLPQRDALSMSGSLHYANTVSSRAMSDTNPGTKKISANSRMAAAFGLLQEE